MTTETACLDEAVIILAARSIRGATCVRATRPLTGASLRCVGGLIPDDRDALQPAEDLHLVRLGIR